MPRKCLESFNRILPSWKCFYSFFLSNKNNLEKFQWNFISHPTLKIYIFIWKYLFWESGRHRIREVFYLRFHLQMATMTRAVPGQSQDVLLRLPHGWQGQKYFSPLLLLFPGHEQGAEPHVVQAGHKLAPLWNGSQFYPLHLQYCPLDSNSTVLI